jgi:isopenicillin N synthase-like dioxygenase
VIVRRRRWRTIRAVVPSLDLSRSDPELAAQLDRALRDVGFVTVRDHGVPDEVRETYFAALREFFALPIEAKEAIAIGNSDCHRGYVGYGAEALDGAVGNAGEDAIGTAASGDLKETLDTGVDHPPDHPDVIAGTPLFGANQWPALPGFRDAVEAYRAAVVAVSVRMHRLMALGLGLPASYFDDLPREMSYNLRLIHYPPRSSAMPAPGQWGCGAHTDYGTLTILAEDGVGGLQVRVRSGDWITVEVPSRELVVNIGDLMAIWTNDRWVSNAHRVVNPAGIDRYSSALFVQPDYHQVVETLPTCLDADGTTRHSPVAAGAYLLSRFDGTHAYRKV